VGFWGILPARASAFSMNNISWKTTGTVILLITVGASAYSLWFRGPAALSPDLSGIRSTREVAVLNERLADDFILWFEVRYVQGMERVGGLPTDIYETIQQHGLQTAVERYAAIHRIALDYAIEHPKDAPIPQEDLEGIATAQYKLVASYANSSKRWIDYENENLKRGVVDAYMVAASKLVPFYRKLLRTPVLSGQVDPQTHIRSAVSREEYQQMLTETSTPIANFYEALKLGVAPYAPWAPFVKGMLKLAQQKDLSVCMATVGELFGPTKQP